MILGKVYLNFSLLFSPQSSNIGHRPSADSYTRYGKKSFQRTEAWGSDFEYPMQLNEYWLPTALSIALSVGMFCITIATVF